MINKETTNQDLEELAKEAKRRYAREYYKKKRQDILAQRKQYRRDNHASILEKERIYRAENPEKIRKWNNDYWKRRATEETTKPA